MSSVNAKNNQGDRSMYNSLERFAREILIGRQFDVELVSEQACVVCMYSQLSQLLDFNAMLVFTRNWDWWCVGRRLVENVKSGWWRHANQGLWISGSSWTPTFFSLKLFRWLGYGSILRNRSCCSCSISWKRPSWFRGSSSMPSTRETQNQPSSLNFLRCLILTQMDGLMALKSEHVLRCWSYKRRLASPPYTAGIKWFVGGKVLFVSVEQMQAMLAVSIYWARVEQKVW